MRTCVGCRQRRPWSALVRVAFDPATGRLEAGRTLPGRGAWLCTDNPECLRTAAKRGAFARALRRPVEGHDIEALREAVEACARMEGRSHKSNEGT